MNGEEMNSASIAMNLTPAAPLTAAAPVAAGAEQAPAAGGGFDQALAAVQAESSPEAGVQDAGAVPMALVSDLLVSAAGFTEAGCAQGTLAGDDEVETAADTAPDASEAGAAAILAQMLAGSSPPVRPETSPAADAGVQANVLQSARVVIRGANSGAEASSPSAESGEDGGNTAREKPAKGSDLAAAAAESIAQDSPFPAATSAAEKSPELAAIGAQSSQPASPAGNSAQAAVQAAASALREAAPAAVPAAPVHAALREPVGTTRWADELGNRLVLMSVRGQQQGSLTLTPEHLGPMEVQISMNRETANVWFGAQHADTRAALAEAMPRLRELLAASGISLGQSGVSEQAPREHFAQSVPHAGRGPAGIDADTVLEKAVPAWRVWRPGNIDTYA